MSHGDITAQCAHEYHKGPQIHGALLFYLPPCQASEIKCSFQK